MKIEIFDQRRSSTTRSSPSSTIPYEGATGIKPNETKRNETSTMGAGALQPTASEEAADVKMVEQRGVLEKQGVMVRAFGTANDLFKCQVYDQVFANHEQRLLDTPAYAALSEEEKSDWVTTLQAEGEAAAGALRAAAEAQAAEGREAGDEERATAPPKVEVLNYKADIATKIAAVGPEDDPAERVKQLDWSRELLVSGLQN